MPDAVATTTQGRTVKRLEIKVDRTGWSWEVKDGTDDDMLDARVISKVNDHIVKKGVKVDRLALDFPNAQNLCG